jgi:hypothetical protein
MLGVMRRQVLMIIALLLRLSTYDYILIYNLHTTPQIGQGLKIVLQLNYHFKKVTKILLTKNHCPHPHQDCPPGVES